MAKILIVAEHDGSKLNPATAKCVACASQIAGAEISIVVFAADPTAVATQASTVDQGDAVCTRSLWQPPLRHNSRSLPRVTPMSSVPRRLLERI